MKNIGVLHVITDTTLQSRFTHAELAELAIEGGADTVQFRQKQGTTRELIVMAQGMQTICEQHNVPLIVNDRADIALAVGAMGCTFSGRTTCLSPSEDNFSLQKPSSEPPQGLKIKYLLLFPKVLTTSGSDLSTVPLQSQMRKCLKD